MITEQQIDQLMSYLYGEMTSEERKAFKKELEENVELRMELDSMKGVRTELSDTEDKDILQPVVFWENSKAESTEIWRSITPWLAIAASICLIIVSAYLTGFHVKVGEDGFKIGFGSSEESISAVETPNDEEIAALIEKKLTAIQEKHALEKHNYEEELAKIKANLVTLQSKDNKSSSSDDIKEIAALLQENNLTVLREYLEETQTKQSQYYEALLAQFSEYVQEQRYEDLILIQQNMTQLQEAQLEQQEQTELILASISDVKQ